MLVTPHAVAGAAIGILIPYPVVSLPLAFGSHYLLDMIPHWQETLPPYKASRYTAIRMVIDILLTAVCLLYLSSLFPLHTPSILLHALVGVLPDADVLIHQFRVQPFISHHWYTAYWDWHCRIQRETGSVWGVLPQLAVVIIGLLLSAATLTSSG